MPSPDPTFDAPLVLRRVAIADGGAMPAPLAAIPGVTEVLAGASGGADAVVVSGPQTMLAALLSARSDVRKACATWVGWAERTVAACQASPHVISRTKLQIDAPAVLRPLCADWSAPYPDIPQNSVPDEAALKCGAIERVLAAALIAAEPAYDSIATALTALGAQDGPPPDVTAAAQGLLDLRDRARRAEAEAIGLTARIAGAEARAAYSLDRHNTDKALLGALLLAQANP